MLNRPRHEQLIADIREAGAGTRLISDGDVAGGINAARYESRIDMCVGIGGSPEGITTACAIKALGGFMQGVLAPKDDAERARGEAAGLDCDHVYELDDLVRGDNTFFVATGVTDGELVDGVRKQGSDHPHREHRAARPFGHDPPRHRRPPRREVARRSRPMT